MQIMHNLDVGKLVPLEHFDKCQTEKCAKIQIWFPLLRTLSASHTVPSVKGKQATEQTPIRASDHGQHVCFHFTAVLKNDKI